MNAKTNNDLITLGPGKGSKAEELKIASNYLRGELAQELVNTASHLSEGSIQLLKFHGSYQQEDRDQRAARKASGHEKAYQFMIRSRIPGGILTSEQYLTHDDIAEQYGNQTVRLTTRQSIQLHGVLKKNLRPTIRAINDALLSTLAACGDVSRNVMGCPAPLSDREQAHIHETVNAVMERIAPRTRAYHELWIDNERTETGAPEHEPLYGPTYLPRKFKVAVAHNGDNCVDVYTQDIGLISVLKGDRLEGFTVLIGGGLGMTHNKPGTYPRTAQPLCFTTSDELLPLIEAIVTVQRDYGDRTDRKHARMKYLVAERGIPWFREQTQTRLGYTLADPRPVVFENVDDHLGRHRQADGKWYFGLFIQSGRIQDAGGVRVRSALRRIAQNVRPGMRITAQQNLLLTDLTDEHLSQVEKILGEHGIETNPASLGIRRHSMACPAVPTCGLAVAESERVFPAFLQEMDTELRALELENERLSIRMTGCPNGCARPYMGDIGLVGRSAGIYDIFLGGDWANTRLNEHTASGIRYEKITEFLRPLLQRWKAERIAGETFGDFTHRLRKEQA
jgi:sulfite reductase (ferredoxin)